VDFLVHRSRLIQEGAADAAALDTSAANEPPRPCRHAGPCRRRGAAGVTYLAARAVRTAP
jgi:hypothetical protein